MPVTVVSLILKKLGIITTDKVKEVWSLVKGAETELERLYKNFSLLQQQLKDNEEIEYHNAEVKIWLDRFRDISDYMEDVLEDWESAVLQLQEDGRAGTSTARKKKVMSLFFLKKYDIAARIKRIDTELDKILQDGKRFRKMKNDIGKSPRRLTSTFVDVSQLVGRNEVKNDVIELLLPKDVSSSENIVVVCMLGMAGLGKTAVAQLVAKDVAIRGYFSSIVWVCATDMTDENRIARTVLEHLQPGSFQSNDGSSLQNMLVQIDQIVRGKKILFILDDVWHDDYEDWKTLQVALDFGINKILVTTHKKSVATLMGARIISLKALTKEECFSIIKAEAPIEEEDMPTLEGIERKIATPIEEEDMPTLKGIRRKIAKKCHGLPLAAKSLGKLLKSKTNIEEWQMVLNSDIWTIEEILSPLLRSYYDLPSIIRQCVTYLAIFPRSHSFNKDELIMCWMAQGYLDNDENVRKDVKGEGYFNELVSRSFFQEFETNSFGNIISVKMHELLHDMLCFLTRYRFVTETLTDSTLALSGKTRHLRLNIDVVPPETFSIDGIENVKSLVVATSSSETFGGSLKGVHSKAKRLRLFEICCGGIGLEENVRGGIEVNRIAKFGQGLKSSSQLRYLGFKYWRGLENLPLVVSQLLNLESLNLRGCLKLRRLPNDIGNLINLKYLCVDECPSITFFPKNIGNLTSLV